MHAPPWPENEPAAPGGDAAPHRTGDAMHDTLPTNAAGKRYITNHGSSSRQRWINASELRSRDARVTSLTSEFQL